MTLMQLTDFELSNLLEHIKLLVEICKKCFQNTYSIALISNLICADWLLSSLHINPQYV